MIKEKSLLVLPIIAPNSTALNIAFSQVYPDPQSHIFPSVETPTGDMENASAPEQPLNPRTGHSSESVIGLKSFKGSQEVCGHPMAL